jgi:plastocyanin
VVRTSAASITPLDVVVYVVGFTEPVPGGEVVIQQRGKKFRPELVAVTAGQRVAFPNGDPFFHNVFSPSAARPFDLGQYRPGESRARLFPRPGVIDVYCNIHPQMSATILVLPNRRFARARPDGSFAIDGVPEGRWRLFAYSRRAERPVAIEVEVKADAVSEVEIAIAETRTQFGHRNKYGEKYRDPTRYR